MVSTGEDRASQRTMNEGAKGVTADLGVQLKRDADDAEQGRMKRIGKKINFYLILFILGIIRVPLDF
jgi:hypothetical protein